MDQSWHKRVEIEDGTAASACLVCSERVGQVAGEQHHGQLVLTIDRRYQQCEELRPANDQR